MATSASDGIIALVDLSRGTAQVNSGSYKDSNEAKSMGLITSLVAAGQDDGFVTLCDPRTRASAATKVRVHLGGVSRISASMDCNSIATSEDRDVML
jgi:hypothetical protein